MTSGSVPPARCSWAGVWLPDLCTCRPYVGSCAEHGKAHTLIRQGALQCLTRSSCLIYTYLLCERGASCGVCVTVHHPKSPLRGKAHGARATCSPHLMQCTPGADMQMTWQVHAGGWMRLQLWRSNSGRVSGCTKGALTTNASRPSLQQLLPARGASAYPETPSETVMGEYRPP